MKKSIGWSVRLNGFKAVKSFNPFVSVTLLVLFRGVHASALTLFPQFKDRHAAGDDDPYFSWLGNSSIVVQHYFPAIEQRRKFLKIFAISTVCRARPVVISVTLNIGKYLFGVRGAQDGLRQVLSQSMFLTSVEESIDFYQLPNFICRMTVFSLGRLKNYWSS
jgi:hypothetical protein